MKCEVCDKEFVMRWTDTHGVGACLECGIPYTIYHYDENNTRIDKPPKLAVKLEWVPIFKRYWDEKKLNCCPGAYNFPGSSYEVATPEEFEAVEEWMECNKSILPIKEQ